MVTCPSSEEEIKKNLEDFPEIEQEVALSIFLFFLNNFFYTAPTFSKLRQKWIDGKRAIAEMIVSRTGLEKKKGAASKCFFSLLAALLELEVFIIVAEQQR